MNAKKKRIVNKDLLKFIKDLPCLCCLHIPSDPDHITTRGAGGNDTADNVWPLCRTHHQQRHYKGLIWMIKNYPALKRWLENENRSDILDKINF